MKTQRKKWWVGAGLLAVMGLAGKASAIADTSAYLNIEVTINATLSVTVNGVASSTDATASWTGVPNAGLVAVTSATVSNNSTALSEKWALSTDATSLDVSGNATQETWAVVQTTANVSHDQVAVQAVFGSSTTASAGCPGASTTTYTVWNSTYIAPPLYTNTVTYGALGAFADTLTPSMDGSVTGGTPGPDNVQYSQMYVNSKRALCWRLVMPSSTYTTHTQEVQVVVTAMPAS